jgi:hypothetical protein
LVEASGPINIEIFNLNLKIRFWGLERVLATWTVNDASEKGSKW